MVSTWQFWLSLIAQVAIAVGTIAAVIVALFGGWLRARFAPPKLTLRLETNDGVKIPVNLTAPDGNTRQTEGRWYHLRVENERRWSPATQVQVFLLRIEEPDAAGEDRLTWIGEMPMRWRHQEIHPRVRTIGYPADCDLCSVIKEKWLELNLLITPSEINAKRRDACRLTLTLQARGMESDSNLLRVQIAWDGKWANDDKEMAQHMVVKVTSDTP